LSAPPHPSAAIGGGFILLRGREKEGERKGRGRKRKGRVRERDYLLYLTSG